MARIFSFTTDQMFEIGREASESDEDWISPHGPARQVIRAFSSLVDPSVPSHAAWCRRLASAVREYADGGGGGVLPEVWEDRFAGLVSGDGVPFDAEKVSALVPTREDAVRIMGTVSAAVELARDVGLVVFLSGAWDGSVSTGTTEQPEPEVTLAALGDFREGRVMRVLRGLPPSINRRLPFTTECRSPLLAPMA